MIPTIMEWKSGELETWIYSLHARILFLELSLINVWTWLLVVNVERLGTIIWSAEN